MRACLIATVVLLSRAAWASGPQLEITPATRMLSFDRTAFDVPGATQRVTARNLGDPVGVLHDIDLTGPFVIVNHGGGLGAGEEEFWDIACQPFEPDGSSNGGGMEIDVCGTSCEDEWIEFLNFFCVPGLLDVDNPTPLLIGYAFDTVGMPLSFQNPGPDPITVTALVAREEGFTIALQHGSLPVTLDAGDRLDVDIAYTPIGPADSVGNVDVMAGTVIAGRARILGETIPQIEYAGGGFPIPLGATYALPLTVRNSFPTARTIMAVSTSLGDAVTGLVGTRLEPGERARGTIALTGNELGSGLRSIAVMFDAGQGDARLLSSSVVPPEFSITAGDDTPADAAIDFGVRRAGSPPVARTLTFSNLTDTDRAVLECFALATPYELVSPCPAMIPAHGSAQLTVRFTPAVPGPFLSAVALPTQGLGLLYGFLTADVIAQQLDVSSAPLQFADTAVTAQATATLAIANRADNPITLPVHVSGDYRADPAITIAPRAQATLTITFAPTAAGDRDGQLVLGANGDPDQHVIALLGSAHAERVDAGVDVPASDGGNGESGGGSGCSAGGAGSLLALLTLVPRWRRRRRLPRTVPAR